MEIEILLPLGCLYSSLLGGEDNLYNRLRRITMKKLLFLIVIVGMLIGTGCGSTGAATESETPTSTSFSLKDIEESNVPDTFLVDGHPIEECQPTYALVRLEDGIFNKDYEVTKENGGYFGKADWRDMQTKQIKSVYESYYERWGVYYWGAENLTADSDRWTNPVVFKISSPIGVFDLLNSGIFSEASVYNRNGLIAQFDRFSESNSDANAKHGWRSSYSDEFCLDPEVDFEWTTNFRSLQLVGVSEINYSIQLDLGKAWFYTGKTLTEDELVALKFQIMAKNQGTSWSGLGFIAQGTSSHGGYKAEIDQSGDSADLLINKKVSISWQLPGATNAEAVKTGKEKLYKFEYVPLGIKLPLNTEIFVYSDYRGWQRFVLTDKVWTYSGYERTPSMLEGENDKFEWTGFDVTPLTPVGCPSYTCQ